MPCAGRSINEDDCCVMIMLMTVIKRIDGLLMGDFTDSMGDTNPVTYGLMKDLVDSVIQYLETDPVDMVDVADRFQARFNHVFRHCGLDEQKFRSDFIAVVKEIDIGWNAVFVVMLIRWMKGVNTVPVAESDDDDGADGSNDNAMEVFKTWLAEFIESVHGEMNSLSVADAAVKFQDEFEFRCSCVEGEKSDAFRRFFMGIVSESFPGQKDVFKFFAACLDIWISVQLSYRQY